MKKNGHIKIILCIFIFAVCFSFMSFSSLIGTSSKAQSLTKGDVDGDGAVTTTDARMILESIMNTRILSPEQCSAADYNQDGKVDTADVKLILHKAVGINENIDISTSDSFRAVWVSIAAGDFPSRQGLGADDLRCEIDNIVNAVKSLGLNAIVLQVRAYADAIYPSQIYPSSYTITGTQGSELPIDVLDYFIKSAHAKGIEIHAWINPYRVSSTSHSTDRLSSSNPAVIHPDWIVYHNDASGNANGIYFNPGIPEVRQLIIDGVMEIVNNYDVDGIHMDDYFYPYSNAENFEDNDTYNKYNNGMNIADWRRNNVDILVQQLHDCIKKSNPKVKFGISPFGVWAKKTSATPQGTEGLGYPLQAYSAIYADSRKWVVNKWVDYICPQIYWQMDYATVPFKTLTDWWDSLCRASGVDLYVGIAAYKGSTSSAFEDGTEIRNQLNYLSSSTSACKGVVFFSYRSLINNLGYIQDTLNDKYGKYIAPDINYLPSSSIGNACRLVNDSFLCLNLDNTESYGPTDHCVGASGMYETVISNTSNGYSLLSNGYYVKTSNIVQTSEMKYLTVLQNISWNLSPDYSEFIVPCSQNVSFTMWMGDTQAELTLYNIYSPNVNVPVITDDNPLFSSVSCQIVNDTTVKIIFKYRQDYHIFGYDVQFINGRLVVSFKNPVGLKSDDLPLYGIKISLDPGHSNTTGATGSYGGVTYYETNLTLDLARRVKQRLEDLGAIVRLTHNGERIKSLDDLIPEYIAWNPDINISIHFNSSTSSSASGNEVWWCYNNSNLLAQTLNSKFCEETGIISKGPKCGYYKVSKLWQFPSVLFETLFMSNPDNLGWYVSGENPKNECAQAITDSITEYFRQQS